MNYHRFNIGKPTDRKNLNIWWAENVSRGVITAGFQGERGDQGESHLRAMREGDRVLAYVSGHGYVGAARVLGDDTYQLHAHAPAMSVSMHLHERRVQWELVIPDVKDAISETEARLHHPISTRVPVANESEAHHLMELLEARGHRLIRDLDTVRANFEQAVTKAAADSASVRHDRLKNAAKLPKKITVVSEVYVRNPDVVAEVLERANGICEHCAGPAPFVRRADNSPFLEVHHRVRLADGGEDTVQNAIALCPNCHRQMHYGVQE